MEYNISNERICELWNLWWNTDPYTTADWMENLTWDENDLVSRWDEKDPEAMNIVRSATEATNAGLGKAIFL